MPYLSSAARLRSYWRCGLLDGHLYFFDLLFDAAQFGDGLLFCFPTGAELLLLRFQVGELFLQFGQPVARRRVVFFAQRLPLDLQLHDPARDFVELRRHGLDLGAELGRRFVDQIDRLVRQKPVGDIAVRQHRGADQRGIFDAHAVVHFVALAQAAQDRNRVLDARLIDEIRAGSAAPVRGPFRRVFGTHPKSWRRCSAARRAPAAASADWRRPWHPRPRPRPPPCAARR